MNTKTKIMTGVLVSALGIGTTLMGDEPADHRLQETVASRIETFAFPTNGELKEAKIYLPAGHENRKDLPAIFLIDFTEQHFRIATDEFQMVINGTKQIPGFEALVVALDGIPDIDAKPDRFMEYYRTYKDMAAYVDGTYTTNTTRTFMGRGSESGIVLMSLFRDNGDEAAFDNFIATDPGGGFKPALIGLLEDGGIPDATTRKKLHFSFSTTNNREACTKIQNLIEEAQFPWLQFASVAYADSDYENTYPVAFAEGLKYIFGE